MLPNPLGRLKSRLIRAILAAALLPAAVQAAAPSPVDAAMAKAQAELSARHYDEAYRQYQKIYQDNGHALAAFTLGMFYRGGWGRAADPLQACGWFEKAAQGKPRIPTAEQFLGDCLLAGTLRQADATQAAHWYEQAAHDGNLGSACSLGQLYLTGLGVDKDPAKGLALCRSVAEGGSVPAMLQTAHMLLDGAGGDPAQNPIRDPAAAYAWFLRAAQSGSAEAQYQIGLMSRDGIGCTADARQARAWFEAAAAQGWAPAYFPTALLYYDEPADPQTGAPTAETLAKDYLWLSVNLHCDTDPAQLSQARDMLKQVLGIMPKTWEPTLDEKLKGHLCGPPGPALAHDTPPPPPSDHPNS